jgi:hypothetical protein
MSERSLSDLPGARNVRRAPDITRAEKGYYLSKQLQGGLMGTARPETHE